MSSNAWVILSLIEKAIKDKINSKGVPLTKWDISIFRGILTGYNPAFIIDSQTKEKLIAADPKSADLIRPILRGRDIKRYDYTFAELWLINVHNGIKDKNIPPVNIEEYPAVKDYLNNYYPKLEKRLDKGVTPYNLRNCAYMDDFSRQKIMYNDICQRLSFCLVPKDIFCVNTVYFIKDNPHLKYLLACLNTNIIDWYYRTLSVQLGEKAVRMFSIYVEKIPLPIPSEKDEIQIASLVDELLIADIDEQHCLEEQIEKTIAKLYDLTQEEQNYLNSR